MNTLKHLTFLVAVTFFAHLTSAQMNASQDSKPGMNAHSTHSTNANGSKALWDIQFNHDLTIAASGDVGMAGAVFYNNEFWVSRWASDTIYRIDMAGAVVSEFTIPGLSGVRSFTTDGTYLYAGNNTTTVYRINPSGQVLAPPHITVPASARFCTYDATLDAGNGGLWIGNFSADILGVSLAGATVATIPATTHGLTGMYGGAFDNLSPGGPFLWIFDQGVPNNCNLVQLSIATGMQTGLVHDVYGDAAISAPLTSGLAGGCFISNAIVPGQITLGGLVQGTPDNILFGYELSAAGIDVEVLSIRTVKGYTQIPLAQLSMDSVAVNFKNNSSVSLDSVNLTIELYDPSTAVTYTELKVFTNVPANATNLVYSQPFMPTSGIGAYEIKASLTTTTTQPDITPANNTLSYNYAVTDTMFARDNGIPDGGAGYSVSASDWAYAVSLFELPANDTVAGIWIELVNPIAMDTTYGVIVNTTAGLPTGIPFIQTPVQIIQGAQTTYYMEFIGGVPLTAGTYAFGCYEGATTTIGLAQSASVFTPATNFFATSTGSWTQSGISTARFIRPVFKKGSASAGLKDPVALGINTYPNPTTGWLTIQVENTDQFAYVVTDMNGKVLVSKTSQNNIHQLDMSNLQQGMYLLTVTNSNNVTGKQLILKK